MSRETLVERRREFSNHVWNHMNDVFQTAFDLHPPLDDATVKRIGSILQLIRGGTSDVNLSKRLKDDFARDPDYFLTVLQLVGLTRSKPLSDLRPALDNAGVRIPSKVTTFASRNDAWDVAAPYFAGRIRSVLTNLLALDEITLPGALEALNQGTWPGYIRQERAKRSGGYAEQRMAILLVALDLDFEPAGKAVSGLVKDVTIAGESFDLVVPNAANPKLCIMSMLHTSNIGQYGESKAEDAVRAKNVLQELPQPPLLGVMADGVGFYSNSAGLSNILGSADEVFQLATLWKVAVVAAAVTGCRVYLVLQDSGDHQSFLIHYKNAVVLVSGADEEPGWVEAGEALIRRAA